MPLKRFPQAGPCWSDALPGEEPWKQEASTGRQRVQKSQQWKSPSSTAWQYLWAKPQSHQLLPRISKVKKTMRRSEMLINNRCKHQLLCLDRSGSQVRLFTSPQGPLETPTLQSSPGTPGPQYSPSELICLSFWQPCPPPGKEEYTMECFDHSNLARSYDKVCHARLADTKCLCKLLLGKRKSKLNLW